MNLQIRSTIGQGSLFDSEGFDAEAHNIVEHRHAILSVFLRQETAGQIDNALFDLSQEAGLRQAIHQLEPTIDRAHYRQLAEELGLPERTKVLVLRRFWRSGVFDLERRKGARGISTRWRRLPFEGVSREIVRILSSSEHVTDWIAALQNDNMCRDSHAAKQLASALYKVKRVAMSQARDLVLSWCESGSIGLLKHSDYPCLPELLMLQQQVNALREGAYEIEAVLGVLRADVIALYRTFHHPAMVTQFQRWYGREVQLWDQSMLHQPAHALQRQQYRDHLIPLLPTLRSDLAHQRGCNNDTAHHLLDIILKKGLSGLIAWRCDDHTGTLQERLERDRVDRTAESLVAGLSEPVRHMILERLGQLKEAITATGTQLLFFPLISDPLSSRYRRRCQRQQLPATLVDDFAARAGLKSGQARFYIKHFMVYGPLGILPQREWEGAFHPHIWSYLEMFKLGRLEGTVDPAKLTEVVNTYTAVLGCPALPRQIVLGVFNHFAKPNSYNSGDGSATAAVPLRKALKIAGVARLHEQWIIVPIELDIQLIGTNMQPSGTTCSALLVFDRGSQCPLGFWVNSTAPTRVEAGLALYQSIFHPDALDWPLRGLPEQVMIPEELTKGGIEDLRRAAQFLMAEVAIEKDLKPLLASLPEIRHIIAELKAVYTPAWISSRRRAPKQQMTIQQAKQEISAWLYKRCFENHRQEPVPRHLRQYGFALPGYDTPAAGWLLPMVDEMTTIRDGVMLNRRTYTDPLCGIEPGVPVRVRGFVNSGQVARAVFVEYIPGQVLHYVSLQPSSKVER